MSKATVFGYWVSDPCPFIVAEKTVMCAYQRNCRLYDLKVIYDATHAFGLEIPKNEIISAHLQKRLVLLKSHYHR